MCCTSSIPVRRQCNAIEVDGAYINAWAIENNNPAATAKPSGTARMVDPAAALVLELVSELVVPELVLLDDDPEQARAAQRLAFEVLAASPGADTPVVQRTATLPP